MSRALGVDLGARRTGIAVSDPEGVLATPVTVLASTGDRGRLFRQIRDLVDDYEVAVVVVGLPRSLDGGEGPAAVAARADAAGLADVLDVPVELHDERLTTVTAHRLLAEAGLDERARRRVIDAAAAAVLLQAWLDARRSVLTNGPTSAPTGAGPDENGARSAEAGRPAPIARQNVLPAL